VNLPDELLDSLKSLSGFNATAFIDVHSRNEFETSIRLNPQKSKQDLPLHQPILWSSYGYSLENRPSFTLDPFFHAGHYYVQESSSMFLEEVLKQTVSVKEPLLAIDLCAAPGGKSTLIQSVLHPESLIVCNEVIQKRVSILKENVIKWGASNMVVTSQDPAAFNRMSGLADLMLIDAPCSGSGLFRREPELVQEWSKQAVQLCSERQRRILADSWNVLKEGGVLIYSTCSYSEEENEQVMDWISSELQAETKRIRLREEWQIEESVSAGKNYGYRFWPYKVRGEGFFIAAFQKITPVSPFKNSRRNVTGTVSSMEKEAAAQWIELKDEVHLLFQGEHLAAVPDRWKSFIHYLIEEHRVRYAGVELGSIVRDRINPDHALALSGLLKTDIPCVELSKEQALDYLRKNEGLYSDIPNGWILIQFEGAKLGWIKGVGKRINNYYPKEWRIRMK
jgi:16S rRNA C967 or C1407 C5-methylase (RsmB/RsmF family)/NOL1/NOP2/fmu family ribosome biogenesis protein